MKKLFTDPHFNVMDGLDTYIDDYRKPDPIPPVDAAPDGSAKFLKLFDDEEARGRRAARSTCGGTRGAQSVAQSRSMQHVARRRAEPAQPPTMTTLICDCNKTMPLDGPALGRRSA